MITNKTNKYLVVRFTNDGEAAEILDIKDDAVSAAAKVRQLDGEADMELGDQEFDNGVWISMIEPKESNNG